MHGPIRRLLCAAILGVCVFGAAVNAAQAATASRHACCARAARGSSTAPTKTPAPCEGFLPLTCCRAAALPGSESSPPPPPAALALAPAAVAAALPRAAAAPPSAAALAPRIAPTRLSVVLLI